ncbi:hypothetical protein FLAN108750_06580 [Flavobacterium antarcticum]
MGYKFKRISTTIWAMGLGNVEVLGIKIEVYSYF